MKRISILIFVVLIAGCVTPPQTPEEVRVGVKKGAAMTKTEQTTVNRPFAATFRDIKTHADKCLNVTVTGSTPGRYGPMVESLRYRSSSKTTNERTGETVVQMDSRATGKMPEGGYYLMLADIEGVSANKTMVTIYGHSVGYGSVFEAILAWAQGKKQACPKFPMGGLGKSFTYHTK
ncbi:MAG: hypothetical protein ACREKR_01380 [Candidatus Methylomirabilales bacterium]